MPCNTVITNTVELGNDRIDESLLLKALQARFGYVDHNLAAAGEHWFKIEVDARPVYLRGGRAESRLPEARLQEVVGQIKQQYALSAIAQQSKRFGWAFKEESAAPTAQRRA